MVWEIDPPVSNFASLERERWRPQLRAGYFNVGDRRYYLYGEKRTTTLAQIQATRFELSRWPHPYPDVAVEVKVAGIVYPFWFLDGKDLIVSHIEVDKLDVYWGGAVYDVSEWERQRLEATDFSPTSTVEITYQYFNDVDVPLVDVTDSFQIQDGKTEYWMPDIPSGAAPVVVTDDVAVAYQGNVKTPEFHYDSSEELVNREGDNLLEDLSLNTRFFFNVPDNQVKNPAFENFSKLLARNTPDDWQFTGPEVGHTSNTYPYHGRYTVYSLDSDYVQQVVPYTGDQLVVSAWSRAMEGTGTAVLGVNFMTSTGLYFVSPSGVDMSLISDDTYLEVSTTGEVTDDTWSELILLLGETDLAHTGVDSALPSGNYQILLKLGGQNVYWDAPQIIEGLETQDFGYLAPTKTTIEYEYEAKELFINKPQNEYPYDISDVDLNPINDVSNQGFLSWIDSGYVDDYQLGYGRGAEGEGIDWIHYTGPLTGGVTGEIQNYIDDGLYYLEIATGELLSLTGDFTNTVGYVPIASTGITGTSDIVALTGEYHPQITEALTGGSFLYGLFFDVDGLTTKSATNNPETWVSVLAEFHDYMEANHTGQTIFGIHGGLNLFDPGVANRYDLASRLDALVIDGLTVDDSFVTQSQPARRHKTALGHRAEQYVQGLTGISDMDILVLDFAQDEYDTDIMAEGRYWAHQNNWWHAAGNPTGTLVTVADDYYSPFGYVSDIPYNVTGISMGRQHLPYARVDGPGKLISRPYFRDSLPRRSEISDHSVPENKVVELSINPTTVAYRNGNQPTAIVNGRPTSPSEEYSYVTKIAILAIDAVDNPVVGVPVHISCTHGEFVDVDNVSRGTTVKEYTDHGGFVYVRYRIDDFNADDSITATVRRHNITSSLQIQVQ